MFVYGLGAIASPLVASSLIENFGPGSLFTMIAAAHAALVIVGLYRMTVRPAEVRVRYAYTPRTSFILGRLLRRQTRSPD